MKPVEGDRIIYTNASGNTYRGVVLFTDKEGVGYRWDHWPILEEKGHVDWSVWEGSWRELGVRIEEAAIAKRILKQYDTESK
jgi:hypothetical protein